MTVRRAQRGSIAALFLAGALALAACSSSGAESADSAGGTATAATPAPTLTSATPGPTGTSSPTFASLRECLAASGTSDLLAETIDLFTSTVDTIDEALNSGDVETFISEARDYATDYDALGRSFKSAESCGDETWAMMTADLGDELIDVGSLMAILTIDMINDPDSTEVLDLLQSVRGVGNQFEVMTEYIEANG